MTFLRSWRCDQGSMDTVGAWAFSCTASPTRQQPPPESNFPKKLPDDFASMEAILTICEKTPKREPPSVLTQHAKRCKPPASSSKAQHGKPPSPAAKKVCAPKRRRTDSPLSEKMSPEVPGPPQKSAKQRRGGALAGSGPLSRFVSEASPGDALHRYVACG